MIRQLVIFTFISFFCFLYSSQTISKSTTFTYQTKLDKDDNRYNYDYDLLKLSLDKTKDKYGDFIMVPLKANYKRIEALALEGKIENIIFKKSVSIKRLNKFGYISFPVDLGIVGYRVGFISKKNINKFKDIKSIEDFKQLSILQGNGWLDNKILEANGFKVITGNKYSYLFRMIANNRADLFMRGTNELYWEWITYKQTTNLSYEKKLSLYYPLPRFFFTSKKNMKAIKRIKEGLIMAYEDGSLQKLWKKHYQKSIDFVDLEKRKIYKIDNPFLEGMDKTYGKYIYIPK